MTAIGKEIVWALHFMVCPVVTIHSATEASGTCHLLELATMVGLDEPDDRDAVVISGTYADRYVKIDGVWRFQQVTLHVGQRSNLADGWAKQPLRSS
jgi:hypothetical protein